MANPNLTLVEELPIVELLAPAADAAGRTGDYVSLKNALKAFIVCKVAQGHADPVTFTPEQASAVAGTGTKAISATRIWSNLDTATSDEMVRRTAAANYASGAALKNKIVVFEIDPAELDNANGFDCITVKTSASNALNLTSADIFLLTAHPCATPPSAIID